MPRLYAWSDNVPCAGKTKIMYDDQRAARLICLQCAHTEECLEVALSTPEGAFGVWGGTTENERRLMIRRRPLADYRR